MRDLKFRLIDTKSAVRIDPKEFFITDSEVFIYYSDFDNSEKVDMRHHVILQYTGLKDKNGAEIYEGDILSTDLSRPYLIVEFRNGAFMYQCHDGGRNYYDFMEPANEGLKFNTKYHEVIGNIYENPELLERK